MLLNQAELALLAYANNEEEFEAGKKCILEQRAKRTAMLAERDKVKVSSPYFKSEPLTLDEQ